MFSIRPPVVTRGKRRKLNPIAVSERRWRSVFRTLVVAAVAHVGMSGLAAADGQIVRAANASIAPVIAESIHWKGGLSFETSAHRAWYAVFWTGKCGDLPFLERLVCVKGRPTWSEVTRTVLSKAPFGARTALKDKLVRLGRAIGFEWARHNDERRIDNDDLERWSEWLKNDANVNGAVERLAEAVDVRLRPE